ncbi:MAG: hypothetical protein GVY07_01810 [Bacteroidetes bacterium]|nr:hypothetical protein [Bacteroidota bacterium]
MQKILVVLQISISLILIISTFLLNRQSSDLLNADYGFSIKDVVTVDLGDISYELLLQEVAINPVLREYQQYPVCRGQIFPQKHGLPANSSWTLCRRPSIRLMNILVNCLT